MDPVLTASDLVVRPVPIILVVTGDLAPQANPPPPIVYLDLNAAWI